jgi:tRNA 2-thiouridine synthesizing protein A
MMEKGLAEAATTRLDFKGLQCPLPVLRANKAIRSLAPGSLVEVLVTDVNAPKDFRSYCETTGHTFVDSIEEEGAAGVIRVTLRKKP